MTEIEDERMMGGFGPETGEDAYLTTDFLSPCGKENGLQVMV
jgi:hypothetical protein